MNRRLLLKQLAALPLLPMATSGLARLVGASRIFRRARPGTAQWPALAEWEQLRSQVGGRLIRLGSAFARCSYAGGCSALFKDLKNPYYINETPNVTQTLGWADAWRTQASAYAVAAASAADVVAAIDFARKYQLRVAVRGGAHSYQGTSNAPDSLLIWTRAMDEIVMHDAFVPRGCASAPVQAVSLGAGNIWMRVYNAVTTRGGRYVQGGGCATVGVAGLVSSGGFGSFSKNFGTAAGGLLEAEVVTADGKIRIANACQNSDLFWALKGGGGGTFGVITRITLLTHQLPEFFGGTFGIIKANSDDAFRRLVERFVEFYAAHLHDPHWGEQVGIGHGNTFELSLVAQGLSQTQVQALWQPFFDWIAASPNDYTSATKPITFAVPAQHWWDPDFIRQNYPSAIVMDPRPGANPGNVWWSGDADQVGQFMHEYESLWLPAALLAPASRSRLSGALFAASRKWRVGLHFNKGLSGAPPDAIARSRGTATNPAVLDAFALAIIASSEDGVYPGIGGHEPDMTAARSYARSVRDCMAELRAIVPNGGSYVSEASYFDAHWQRQYWGAHYARLAEIKQKYDPAGLFIVHNGVGSERWSADGFTRLGSG